MKANMEKNVLLTIAYDGSTFHGWQKQPETLTVQGYLEQIMSNFFGCEILLSGTSRTDAGVHALGQKASFKSRLGVPIDKMALVINNALCAAEDGGYAKAPLRIIKAEEMPSDFHARFDCKGKEYVYKIRDGIRETKDDGIKESKDDGIKESKDDGIKESKDEAIKGFKDDGINGPKDNGINEFKYDEINESKEEGIKDSKRAIANNTKDAKSDNTMIDLSLVFERNYVYHVNEKLDVAAMNEAAKYLVGEHDFKSFEAAGGNPRETTVRTMTDAYVKRVGNGHQDDKKLSNRQNNTELSEDEGTIEFHIRGNGFLYNMVRIMTGTLVEVGQGKKKPEEIQAIIEATDRAKAGHTAPPNGLYLAEIFY